MTKLTRLAVEDLDLGTKEADRCRNFFAMGLSFWLYDRSLEPTKQFIIEKFGKRPAIAEANRRALEAGYHYGENTEAFTSRYPHRPRRPAAGRVSQHDRQPGLAWGLITAARQSDCELFYGSYPITPASDILHELAKRKNFGVRTFQAEDEIAAVTSVIGAPFAGAMGVTGTSGPGLRSRAKPWGWR